MYLDYTVKIPRVEGKITLRTIKNATYVNYEYGRTYDPKKQYTNVSRVTIGKVCDADRSCMYPNQNYLTYFPDEEAPTFKSSEARSACLRVGTNIVIDKIFDEYKLRDYLGAQFKEEALSLLLDLVSYTIICENNAGQYYPDYAFNHALHSTGMHIYSDSSVSNFLNSVTDNQRIGFLNSWNERRNHREKIYISYDSTTKNCQVGDLRIVEFGAPKVDLGLPIFNYAIAYDIQNKEPLFYEEYPGSINDVSQFQYMIDKTHGYGYRSIGFILDRGYFSKANIRAMDQYGYSFIMMIKGCAELVKSLVLSVRGTFENKRECNIRQFKVYGTTRSEKLFQNDEEKRYFHIFYSDSRGSIARENLDAKIEKLSKFLKRNEFQTKTVYTGQIEHYFTLFYDEKDGTFLGAVEKADVIEAERELCGYFVLVTSEKMSAREAISLYKSRDASEKLFRGDKSYLGDKSIRVYSDESVSAKIFAEFIALIIRSRIYTYLKDEMLRNDTKSNYMTVPAAIRELEKIEIIKSLDGKYRINYAVTATQKAILNAFGIDVPYVKKEIEKMNTKLTEKQEETNGKAKERHDT